MYKRLLIISIIIFLMTGCTVNEEPVEKKKEYYCDEGYELIGTTCLKREFVKNAKVDYSCDGGYKLESKKCNKYDEMTYDIKSSCKSGYTFKDGICIKEIKNGSAFKSKCPSTYALEGKRCIRTLITAPNSDGSCSIGIYNSSLELCLKNESTEPSLAVECPLGYEVKESWCVKTDMKSPTHTKICKSGYKLSNDKCIKLVETREPEIEYTCDKGLRLDKDDKKCYKEERVDAKEKEEQ